VLTAKTQYSLKNAKGYFEEHLSVGDYYDDGQKTSGQWFGEGAEILHLAGRVEADDFLALCDNRNPTTGDRLTQRLRLDRPEQGTESSRRRIFYDFTFSPPKSVSIIALVAEDERVLAAHQRALAVAIAEFEHFAATRVRRRLANESRVTGNVVAALFTHDSSRALDPHLHTHCIVFNATFDQQEGRWKALQNYEMLRARKYVETLYYHELAKDLQRFGYKIENHPRGDFQIEGVPEELCERFSKRHEQISEALTRLLNEKPELARGNLKDLRESLATAERSRKMRNLTRGELRNLWNAQLSTGEKRALQSLAQQQSPAQNESGEAVCQGTVKITHRGSKLRGSKSPTLRN
jgi:conjugative relaxase-like TrwC/TraI family protein